jgi:hypothetical protein
MNQEIPIRAEYLYNELNILATYINSIYESINDLDEYSNNEGLSEEEKRDVLKKIDTLIKEYEKLQGIHYEKKKEYDNIVNIIANNEIYQNYIEYPSENTSISYNNNHVIYPRMAYGLVRKRRKSKVKRTKACTIKHKY